MADALARFPLFPLGLVCLPGEAVPLHIFEERYKTMIGECLDGERPFGIVWLSDQGLRQVGCTAAVTEVLERLDDGRMNILVRGGHPFRLLRRVEDLPYPAGEIELLADDAPPADAEAAAAARLAYAALVERATGERPDDEALAAMTAYDMAATVALELDAKQELLELRTEDERMRALAARFADAMRRLEYAERASERARSNGHVRRRV